jgi:VanZ family protein
MGVIFYASTTAGSFGHSSRIIAPLVRWLVPGISEESLHTVILTARKLGHLTEYAFFAVLLWRAVRHHTAHHKRLWDWRHARITLVIIALYATSDEIHQCFVPGRQGAVTDVLLDTLGGSVGLLVLWRVGRLLKRW